MSDRTDRQVHDGRPAQNVKPKMNSGDDDQLKKEKPGKARRSRSIDSEQDQGRRQDRHSSERSRRGRSEEGRRRDRRDGDTVKRRKNVRQDDIDDTECAICFCSYDNIFKTPKLLACGHTFCLECLARINVTSTELKSLSCPVCREVTDIPHGKDLPRLGNNQDIIEKLPPQMQRILSIRFKRSKGKLEVKNQPLTSPTNMRTFTLSKKKQETPTSPAGNVNALDLEQGMAVQTVINVGRPPSRVRGRVRRLFRSDRCYYAVVVTIITITVILMLIGILAFVIIPPITVGGRPVFLGNHTTGEHHEESP